LASNADIGLGKVDLEAGALDLVAGPAMGAVSRALARAIGWRPAPDASMLWISTGVPVVWAIMVIDSPLGVMIFYMSLARRVTKDEDDEMRNLRIHHYQEIL
jgi:hypothetical protein